MTLRGTWRLVRLLGFSLVYTTFVSIAAMFVPQEARPRFRAVHQRRGARVLCGILGIRMHCTGAIPTDDASLIVSNHFGVIDPLILAAEFEVAFVAKAELRKWPFVGWVTRELGVIFVERDRHGLVGDFLRVVRARLADGVPVLVFPEGTTNEDESVRPFKTGAFASVAGMATAGVVPVYLKPVRVNGLPAVNEVRQLVTWAGGGQSFVAHLLQLVQIEGTDVEIRVGTPIAAANLDRKHLARKAHAAVVALASSDSEVMRGTLS